MAPRRAVVAEASVLRKHGAEVVAQPEEESGEGPSVVAYKGWTFKSSHSNILNSQRVGELARRVSVMCGTPLESLAADEDSIVIQDTHLHVPPMIFGDDVMQIQV